MSRKSLFAAMTALASLTCFAIASAPSVAFAQRGGGMGGGGGGGGKSTQSGPVQNKTVGPINGGAQPTDDEDTGSAPLRAEPQVQLPQDPLAISPELKARIGTDDPGHFPPATGETTRSFRGYYESHQGDYRLRLAPPFYIEQTRGIGLTTKVDGVTKSLEDSESLTSLLYYRRRSLNYDADVVFPLAWRLRDHDSKIYVLGPLAHREAPGAHDNWFAPLVFEGKRPDGGYFHSPLLLTTSHWNKDGAFTVIGPYFRDRTGSDVDWGVAPFVFRGENKTEDGTRKTYTLIPPIFYYHRERELDGNDLTIAGPVYSEKNQKREIFDVFPFYYSIKGRPETGGIREQHTTLFPFFHSGESDEKTLFVLPGYYHKTTHEKTTGAPLTDTTITPFYSHSVGRGGATDLQVAGPVLPMYWRYTDKDSQYSSAGLFPFYWAGHGPATDKIWTPLYAKFENYGTSRTYWAFPTIVVQKTTTGWETDLHPLVYLGRSGDSSHTVVFPAFWDFSDKKGRTTIGFPAYWRFADYTDNSVVQVAGNTLYMEKRVAGGKDWQFHVLPFFSYGENPSGYFWDVLFGLAGFTQNGATSTVRALWIPIQTGGPPAKAASSHLPLPLTFDPR